MAAFAYRIKSECGSGVGLPSETDVLPVSFFDARITGDILQRVDDNFRIEEFLTSASLNILYSFVNLVVFGIVLAVYSLKIFLVFLAGTLLYILWVTLFVKPRAKLDYLRFKEMSAATTKLINIVNGMQEIKLSRTETSMSGNGKNTRLPCSG
jgi:ATP-binding cassette subfamily B protein